VRLVSHIVASPLAELAAPWRTTILRAGLTAREEARGDRAMFEMSVDLTAPGYQSFMEWVAEAGFSVYERVEAEFTQQEKRSAEWVTLVVRSSPVKVARDLPTNWDWSAACARCGAGASRCKALTLPSSRLPKRGLVRQTEGGELLLHAGVVEAKNGAARSLTGHAVSVVDTDGSTTPWRVISTLGMPMVELDPAVSGLTRDGSLACRQCDRDAHFAAERRAFTPTRALPPAGAAVPPRAPAVVRQIEGKCGARTGTGLDLRFLQVPRVLIPNDGGRVADALDEPGVVDVVPILDQSAGPPR